MARYHYVVLVQAIAGREADFDEWYDTQHLADVKRVPGVVGARRFAIEFQKVYDLDAPRWRAMAIYEIETDDPKSFLDNISKLSGTAAMPSSDAMTKQGLVQVVALPVSD